MKPLHWRRLLVVVLTALLVGPIIFAAVGFSDSGVAIAIVVAGFTIALAAMLIRVGLVTAGKLSSLHRRLTIAGIWVLSIMVMALCLVFGNMLFIKWGGKL